MNFLLSYPKPIYEIEEDDDEKDGVWDSIEGSSTGMGGLGLGVDLADFAAAALKFREETKALMNLKAESREVEVDAMDRLFQEQEMEQNDPFLSEGPAGNGEEEEPEWADGDGDSNQAQTSTVTSQSKRNLLFEV